ncbi:hypothetical protein AVT_27410 (plasmid) [Bacillus tropicus]|uniref:anthrax toxin lethal factor-related metalloendopeptidase n=1 Tax=Bacillus TaxID=1386 RepID=UPI0013F29DE9|nr:MULTISPECIES: hypothetical protein [Bacillus]WBO93185.1 hypothetical protein AVT_27410 [Bacillus tropicus]
MKKLIQHIIKVDVKTEAVVKKEAVETLLTRLPVNILEVYHAVGGKIVFVDGDITKADVLKGMTEKQTKDIDGNIIPLDQHYVYAKGGTEPTLVIQASEDYGYQMEKGTNVYYEIGKAIIRDALKLETITNPTFIDLLNKIKAAQDAPNLLFSETLQQHTEQFTELYAQANQEEMETVFARIFAYYVDPHFKDALKIYAPDAFKYMGTIDW